MCFQEEARKQIEKGQDKTTVMEMVVPRLKIIMEIFKGQFPSVSKFNQRPGLGSDEAVLAAEDPIDQWH